MTQEIEAPVPPFTAETASPWFRRKMPGSAIAPNFPWAAKRTFLQP